jgi:hypothetical protein
LPMAALCLGVAAVTAGCAQTGAGSSSMGGPGGSYGRAIPNEATPNESSAAGGHQAPPTPPGARRMGPGRDAPGVGTP